MTTDQISQDSIVRVPIVGIVRIPVTDIERVPITGIERMPIVGVLQTGPTEELDWDNVYAQLVNYIKFAAKQVAQQYQTGAVNTAEALFPEGQLLLYHCFTLYKTRPFNEFSALFKASLWRKLREIGSKKSFIQVDLEDAYDLGYSDDVVDDMYNYLISLKTQEENKTKHSIKCYNCKRIVDYTDNNVKDKPFVICPECKTEICILD